MKRICKALAIILALVMLLSGCDLLGMSNDDHGEVINGFVQQGTTPEDNTTAPAMEEETEAPWPTETVPQETTAPKQQISFGKWQGTTYTNLYLGCGCKLDGSWTIKKVEELQAVTGMIQGVFSETDMADVFANTDQIMDMQVENATELVSMNVLYTKLTPVQKAAFMMASEEQIVDNTLATSDAMVQAYAQAGIDDARLEKVSVNFMGKQRFAIRTTAKLSGMDYYILQFFDYNNGDYYTCITLGSFINDKTMDLADLWFVAE